jgi:hypothetical protein
MAPAIVERAAVLSRPVKRPRLLFSAPIPISLNPELVAFSEIQRHIRSASYRPFSPVARHSRICWELGGYLNCTYTAKLLHGQRPSFQSLGGFDQCLNGSKSGRDEDDLESETIWAKAPMPCHLLTKIMVEIDDALGLAFRFHRDLVPDLGQGRYGSDAITE